MLDARCRVCPVPLPQARSARLSMTPFRSLPPSATPTTWASSGCRHRSLDPIGSQARRRGRARQASMQCGERGSYAGTAGMHRPPLAVKSLAEPISTGVSQLAAGVTHSWRTTLSPAEPRHLPHASTHPGVKVQIEVVGPSSSASGTPRRRISWRQAAGAGLVALATGFTLLLPSHLW